MITIDLERIGLAAGDRVLDIGCGSGRHACRIYETEKVWVFGMDASYPDVCQARDRLAWHDAIGAHRGGRWSVAAGDLTCLPFADAAFDRVVCSEVMEHIPADRKAAEELVRVLKPDGSLVVSVPRYYPESICWRLSSEYFSANGGHVRIYRKSEIIRLFGNAGARFRFSHHAHSLHTPYWWLKCWVGPAREDQALVRRYHQLLTWDIMKKPRITRLLDTLLNPVLGKSLVLYFRKPA